MNREGCRGGRQTGFTLIELGVVVAVMSILAGLVVPDFIQMARNQLAKNAAYQVTALQEAAKWHFHQSALEASGTANPLFATWPGETDPLTCPSDGKPLAVLVAEGAVESDGGTNPWGRPYEMRLLKSTDPRFADIACAMRVATDVPTEVQSVFGTYVTGGTCDSSVCGSPAAGYVRCCSIVPKPGLEAALTAAMNSSDADAAAAAQQELLAASSTAYQQGYAQGLADAGGAGVDPYVPDPHGTLPVAY